MKAIQLYVPEPDLAEIEQHVKAKRYPNRAEFIRIAIKQVLREERKHVLPLQTH